MHHLIITGRQSWLQSSVCALQLLLLDLPGQSAAMTRRPVVTTCDSSVMLADDC